MKIMTFPKFYNQLSVLRLPNLLAAFGRDTHSLLNFFLYWSYGALSSLMSSSLTVLLPPLLVPVNLSGFQVLESLSTQSKLLSTFPLSITGYMSFISPIAFIIIV